MSGASSPLAELARSLDCVLDDVIGPSVTRAAAVIFPYDWNVGNHMMWRAMGRYLADRNIPLVYTAGSFELQVDKLRQSLGRDGVVLLNGGVTFSSLWPEHLSVKRAVARACRDHPIVSLPATILPVEGAHVDEARAVFSGHPQVTVLARDPVSGLHAREVLGNDADIRVAHDLAFRLRPIKRVAADTNTDIVWLSRDDAESAACGTPAGVETFDWPHTHGAEFRRAYNIRRAARLISRVPIDGRGGDVKHVPRAALFQQVSAEVVRAGTRSLRRGRVLVTDRMHPHVLALLQGQPVVLLPDKYGKNRAVYDFSSHVFPSVRWADTPEQALETARLLAAGE